MKLYIIVGRINGVLGFGHRNFDRHLATGPSVGCDDTQWDILAFSEVNDAHVFYDELKHGTAKHCRVVEIEIPDA